MYRRWFSRLLLMWALAAGVSAAARASEPAGARPADGEPKEGQPSRVTELAERLWELSGVVLDNHVDPPTRQEMLLAGTKAVLRAGRKTAPPDLSRRVSGVTTREDFLALVRDVCPKVPKLSAPPTDELDEAVLNGLLEAVPGRPHLISGRELKVAGQIAGNRYVGIGIQVRWDSNKERGVIVTPIRGGPAHRAGMRPGDVVLAVDGKDTRGVGIRRLVDMIAGDEATTVTVVVRQPGEREARTLRMIRGVVPFENVVGYGRGPEDQWTFAPGAEGPVAYVGFELVSSSTVHELRSLENRLRSEGFRAAVLDLRFARGDSVHNAALVAESLVDGGALWRTQDARGRVKEYRAGRDCLFRDWPLAVLVGENTGAAAGWVAAALQDCGRAVLVGEPARWQRYARTMVYLPGNRAALELPTAAVERMHPKVSAPDNSKPPAIEPDHPVKTDAKQRNALQAWFFAKDKIEIPTGADAGAPQDPALARAVELLQAALKKPQKSASKGRKEP